MAVLPIPEAHPEPHAEARSVPAPETILALLNQACTLARILNRAHDSAQSGHKFHATDHLAFARDKADKLAAAIRRVNT